MKDITTTSFGLIIAYLLPGLAGLYGITLLIDPVGKVSNPIFNTQSDVALFLMALAAAIIVGLQVNVIRWVIYEEFIFRELRLPRDLDYGALKDEVRLKSIIAINEENYRYHQFYGGMTVTMPLLYVGWVRSYYATGFNETRHITLTTCFIIVQSVVVAVAVIRARRGEASQSETSQLETDDPKANSKGGVFNPSLFYSISALALSGFIFWVFYSLNSARDRILFILATIVFAILEVGTGDAARTAKARYVHRTKQILKGAKNA
jgi:hypothetical protein